MCAYRTTIQSKNTCPGLRDHLPHERREVIEPHSSRDDTLNVSDDSETTGDEIGYHFLGLSHCAARDTDERSVAGLKLRATLVGEGFCGSCDLEHSMLGCPTAVYDLDRARDAFLREPLHRARQDVYAVLQQSAVRRIVHVALDHGGVGAETAPTGNAVAARELDDTCMNLMRQLLADRRERSAEGGELRDRILIESREPPVHEARPNLSLELPQRPALDLLEHAATKKTVRRDARTASLPRARPAWPERLRDQLDQSLVIEQSVDRLEKVVLDQRRLPSERHVEQRGLPMEAANHRHYIITLCTRARTTVKRHFQAICHDSRLAARCRQPRPLTFRDRL